MLILEKALAGLLVITVADLLQLPSVKRKLIFSRFSNEDGMKDLLDLQLWCLFKYGKLTEVLGGN